MDGWMGGCMDGWMGGWVPGLVFGRIDHGWTDIRMNGRAGRWADGRMNVCMHVCR